MKAKWHDALTLPVGEPRGVRTFEWPKLVLLVLLALGAYLLGGSMPIDIFIMSLGLFNIAVISALLLRRDITWGFLFYLTSVIFFQTGFWIRLPAFPDLYPARIALIFLYLAFVIQIILGLRKVPPLGRIEKAMLAFLVVLFISVITSGQKPRWLLLMRGYVYPFMFYYFARAVVNEERQVRLVLTYLAILGIYLGVMGVFERMKWYDLVFPKFIVDPTVHNEGLARLGFRVRGIFLQPAILGCVMTMGFFAAWYNLSRMSGIVPRIMKLVLLFVTPATIFFTQTRSVYAGFFAALTIGAIWSRLLRPLCIGLILAGMVGVFFNWENLGSEDRDVGGMGDTNTIDYRLALMAEGLEIFMDNPFFGCGFMNFGEVAPTYRKPRMIPFYGFVDLGYGAESVPHNIFLTIVAEQGLLGIIPYFLIYFFILRTSIQARRDLPSEGTVSREYVVCVWCAIAAYYVNAMLLELRYFEYVNVLFFFIIGSMVGMHERYLAGKMSPGGNVRAALPAPERGRLKWAPLTLARKGRVT